MTDVEVIASRLREAAFGGRVAAPHPRPDHDPQVEEPSDPAPAEAGPGLSIAEEECLA
jgi:hypothetical protein